MKLQVFSMQQSAAVHAQTDDRASPAYLFVQITAEQNGVVVASLCLYDNPCISYHNTDTMLFGNLKLPAEDTDACYALFRKAEEVACKAGKQTLLGPMNGSTWHDYRLPLQGDKPAFSGDCHAPATWGAMLQQAGYTQADTYHSALAAIGSCSQPIIPGHIGIRPITPDSLTKDLRQLYPLCMAAFARSPYFSPVSEDAFVAQYEVARPLLQTGLSSVAFYNGRAVAFALAYPDSMCPGRKAVVIKTIARHPDAHIPGLIKSMVDTLYYTAGSKGYTHAIHAFMHDDNRSVKRSAEFGGSLLRSYALFAKSLNSDG